MFASLREETQQVQKLFRSWRSGNRADSDNGTLQVLQMAIDMTGYQYALTIDDVEDIGNLREVVRERVIKSTYQDADTFGQPAALKRLEKFMELMIAHNYDELLLNNIWMNYFIRLLVALGEFQHDECKMVAGYLCTLVLVNLAFVLEQLHKGLEGDQFDESENPSEKEKHRRYILKVLNVLLRSIANTCGYASTLPIIAKLFCKMLQAYPKMYVVRYSMLRLFETFLQHRHGKMFQTVAACFKNLLNADIQDKTVVDKVAKFIVEKAGAKFTQSMIISKISEKVAMEVIVSVQKLNYAKPIFEETLMDKVRQQMFNSDEKMRGHAIDFHVCSLCTPDETDSHRNRVILQHILKLYEQYDHNSNDLTQLITDLWKLEFFDDWDMLFDLLDEAAAGTDNHFMLCSVVLVINKCYALLMNDLEQQPSEHARLIDFFKNFMLRYPSGLKTCISYEYAYTALLQSADTAYYDVIKANIVNVNRYYENLFMILEEVAWTGSNFYMLSQNLLVIRSYWNNIQDVEQCWAKLLQHQVNEFLDTRSKLNSRNIGKAQDVTEQYAVSLTRLTAFLELDPNVQGNLHSLMGIVLNDCRLLDRMKMNNLQMSMFYRLYKCLFCVLINGFRVEASGEPSTETVVVFQQTGRRLKKRLLELLRTLIKQLQQYDESLDTSVHMFISLCDMLILTQAGIADINVVDLRDMVYAVEPAVLQQMAKFLLNYIFSRQFDWHEAPIMKQKQMLAKYTQLYDMHKSLPRITDAHFILANYALDSAFDQNLRELMKVLYRADLSQFCEVICQAAFQLLQVYKSESSVKNFFSKFQTYALAVLTANDQEKYGDLLGMVIEKILNNLMHILSDPETAPESKRMLKLIEPLLLAVSIEDRLNIQNLLQRHPEYERLSATDRKAVQRFVKRLNPL